MIAETKTLNFYDKADWLDWYNLGKRELLLYIWLYC